MAEFIDGLQRWLARRLVDLAWCIKPISASHTAAHHMNDDLARSRRMYRNNKRGNQ